jgi:cytochrome c-type biogenesis CcmH protein
MRLDFSHIGRKGLMMRIRIAVATAALMVFGAVGLVAQSTAPERVDYDPNAPRDGHYHEGEIGEKLLLLEGGLKCNCGCGLDVHSCQFQMQCGTSPVWSARIRDALEAGETVEAIEASFVADFGKTVLLLPPAEGFNLVGYFLPALAIVSAGMLVGLIARGGTRREDLVPVEVLTDDDAARLGAAMKTLDELESPDW